MLHDGHRRGSTGCSAAAWSRWSTSSACSPRCPPTGSSPCSTWAPGPGTSRATSVRWARREGRRVRVFALDRDAATLQIAARLVRDYPEIRFLRGDALALPIRRAAWISRLRDDPAPPGAGRGRAVPGRGGSLGARRVRGQRPGAEPSRTRRGVADHAVHHPRRDLAPRRAAVREAVVHAARGERLCERAGLKDADVVHHRPYLRFCAVRAEVMDRRRRVVVGARAGRAARPPSCSRTGHAVALLDKAGVPRPRVCGEYLSPEAARVLDRLGV